MDTNALRQAAALGAEGSPVYIEGVPLHKIELRRLRHAAVLAFEGNFARAAAKLYITPSALSQSIAKLEEDLGLILFDREKSGITLSQVGRQFIGRIDKLLFDARGLVRDLTLASGAVSGDAVFGVSANAAKIVLSDLVREMVRVAPHLRLKVASTINEVLLEYLLLEGFEFVICDTPVRKLERLTVRKLANLTLEFYVRTDHPLARRESFALDDLKSFTMASSNLTGENYDSVRTWLGLGETDEFPGAIWCDEYSYLMDAVLEGDAVLLAPSAAVTKETAGGMIRKVTPSDVGSRSNCDLYLVTLAERSVSPAIKVIIERMEAILASKISAT